MYCSLHFRDEIVGYVILRNPEFLYDHPEQFDIQSEMCIRDRKYTYGVAI